MSTNASFPPIFAPSSPDEVTFYELGPADAELARELDALAQSPETVHPVLPPRYKLGERLGIGGLANVYLAHDTANNRFVAIKTTRPDRLFSGVHLTAEANVLQKFDHPGIPHLFSAETSQTGSIYLVMTYVEGCDLSRAIAHGQQDVFSLEHRAIALAEACSTIDYAHKTGYVHRDVKPSNLLIDSKGNMRVIDWGLAQPISLPAPVDTLQPTSPGSIIDGTLRYMAPEQTTCLATPAADVYSLAATAYEFLQDGTAAHFRNFRARRSVDCLVELQTSGTGCVGFVGTHVLPENKPLVEALLQALHFKPESRPSLLELATAFKTYAGKD